MKKRTVKLLSLLLALVMVASAACLSVLAESKQKYHQVTLIGDSIATALRMEWRGEGAPPEDVAKMYRYNEDTGIWTRTGATNGRWVENSWPARVVRGVGLNESNLYNYGREAFSSNEFRRMLDTSYTPTEEDLPISDGLFAQYGADMQGRNLDYFQTQIPEDIHNSDLVLVGMGSNDIFSYAMVHYGNVTAGLEGTALTDAQLQALEAIDGVVSTLVANKQFEEAWAKVMETAKTVNALETTLLVITKVILQGVQKFITNWDVIINKIHEYNPDATVMAVSLFNGVSGLYLTDSIKLDVGQIMSPIFNVMNAHMKSYAQKTGYYTYVDCTQTDHPGWPTAMDIVKDTSQLMVYMMLCTHPTYEGQEYMAEQVLAALEDKDSAVKDGVRKNTKDGNWYLYKDGKINTRFTGFASNEYGTWRIVKGKVDFNAYGVTGEQKDWRYVQGGKVITTANGVYQNRFGWWKVTNGKVDFNFTGIASNKYGTWYLQGGKVNFLKYGKVKYNGVTYKVVAGKVVK